MQMFCVYWDTIHPTGIQHDIGLYNALVELVRQPSPLFCSNLDLEYIVFSLQNIVVKTPYLKNPEGVEVSPLGNLVIHVFQNGRQ